jgi:hypothetical protein
MTHHKTRGNVAREVLAKLAVWRVDETAPECRVHAAAMVAGAFAAWLTPLFDFALDPAAVTKIQSAVKNHGITADDAIAALPGELEKYGAAATDAFLKGGDKVGKDWSHIKSQFNRPDLASDPANAIWEDGTVNRARGKADMTYTERVQASFDNHWDGLMAAAQTPEFWQRTLGNAMESAVYAACIAAVDQILIHRDELINGSTERRKILVKQILETSGVTALGALPTSVVLALVVAVVPGVEAVLIPLGVVGMAGLGLRLFISFAKHPSKQELEAISGMQRMLDGAKLQFSPDGRLRCRLMETLVYRPAVLGS